MLFGTFWCTFASNQIIRWNRISKLFHATFKSVTQLTVPAIYLCPAARGVTMNCVKCTHTTVDNLHYSFTLLYIIGIEHTQQINS